MTPLAALTFEQTALLLSWVAIVVLAFAMSGLLRQVHALTEAVGGGRRRPSGPPSGTILPEVAGLDGETGWVLLFADRDCGACEQALESLAAAARGQSPDFGYAVLYRGDAPAPRRQAVTTIPHADRIFAALGVTLTPMAVAVNDRRAVIASSPVGSPELLDKFLHDVDQGASR